MNSLLLSVLHKPVDQKDFAAVVRVSEARVSQLLAEGVLEKDGTLGDWLAAYTERLREQAAGRGHELTMERAALARSQRVGQDLKNAAAQGTYAPIGLLTDVLAAVSSAVVDRFDALPGELAKHCPDLDAAARHQVARVIASSRNEWVRGTASLVSKVLDELTEPDTEEPLPDLPAEDEALEP